MDSPIELAKPCALCCYYRYFDADEHARALAKSKVGQREPSVGPPGHVTTRDEMEAAALDREIMRKFGRF